MPLRCFRINESIFSFSVESDADWERLRADNAADKNLKMPCCGAGVTLRTSKLGTKHFAHARRGTCSTAPETAEHLLAKRLIVDGINLAGWEPAPEQAGDSPGFGQWIADVMASKNQTRIAFEAQWSRQAVDETHRRQERYAAAGVRALWFFRQHDFPVDKNTPAFLLTYNPSTSGFLIRLPSPAYDPLWLRSKDKTDDHFWQQSIELSRFVECALTHRLKFAPALGADFPVDVITALTVCWRCDKETRVVMELVFAASRRFPGCADIPVSIHSLSECLPDGDSVVTGMLPSSLLKTHGIGAIKRRHSRAEGHDYLSNGCVHCDALQGRFYEHELVCETEKTFEVERKFEESWGPLLEDAASDVYRWWFDETSSAEPSGVHGISQPTTISRPD